MLDADLVCFRCWVSSQILNDYKKRVGEKRRPYEAKQGVKCYLLHLTRAGFVQSREAVAMGAGYLGTERRLRGTGGRYPGIYSILCT
jgi:hypothetical protein